MKINMTELNAEIEAGNVNKQVHPTLPLGIYKYSQQCVFSQHWNETTLRCRGVVLDDTGEIVINGFPKFFNHNQIEAQAELAKRRAEGMGYRITDKMDGSLIQVAWYKGTLVIASSGSFTSPQALKAAEIIGAHAKLHSLFENGKSYLFELIYPENRIVLNYGDKVSLTLLAIRDTETGQEYPLYVDKSIDRVISLATTIEVALAELSRAEFINKEGFIVKFDDGFRVKLKYDEYCRLHKIVSGVNERYVWEAMRDGQDLEVSLAGIPDELFDFVKDTIKKLKFDFHEMETEAQFIYLAAMSEFPTRKEQAAWIIKNHKDLSAIVFSMLDKKEYASKIWKQIEPQTITRFGFGQFPDEA
jgi:hypothetical protein